MDKQFTRLLIIDGSYMLHRSLHVPELFALSNSTDEKIGGVYQFLKSLNFEVKKHVKYYPVVCWDSGLSQRRVKLFPSYKDREIRKEKYASEKLVELDEYLETYKNQRDILIEMLKSFGIPSIRINGWECDDLIYIITKITDDSIIVSDDKDFYQLVSDEVKVSRPLANEVISLESLPVSPEVYLTAKCLTGDRSDNIPKVADGMGEKNAGRVAQLIHDEKDNYLSLLEESAKKVDKLFLQNHDVYLLNRKLIDLREVDSEITTDILQIIKNSILSILGKSNYFKALKWIGTYEIKDLDVDQIMLYLKTPFKHVL